MPSIPTLLMAGASHPEDWTEADIALVSAGRGLSTIGFFAGASDGNMFVALDLSIFPSNGSLVNEHPALFSLKIDIPTDAVVDPRHIAAPTGYARVRSNDPASWQVVASVVEGRFDALSRLGISGVVVRGAHALGSAFLARVAEAVQARGLSLLIDATKFKDDQIAALRGRIDGFVLKVAGQSAAEITALRERLRTAGPLLLELGGGKVNGMHLALADGLIVDSAQEDIAAFAGLLQEMRKYGGETRLLTGPAAPIAAIIRCDAPDLRYATKALLLLVDKTKEGSKPSPQSVTRAAGLEFDAFEPVLTDHPLGATTMEVWAFRATRSLPILANTPAPEDVMAAANRPRLVLERISPSIEGGDFAVKRVVGETVLIDALLYGDGHEQLAAELQWRAIDASDWQVARMKQLPNDAWQASLTLDRLGRHEFAVEGWLDRFGGFRRDFGKKRDAGVAEPVDYAEGRLLVERAQDRADSATAAGVAKWLARYDEATTDDDRASLLLGSDIATLMDVADDRPHRIRSAPQWIDAERLQARFSSWYELFPRSQTDDAARHGTFSDVVDRLPAIRAMGFDTLYFPPIHPIGTTNRKGPNNTLTPGPQDVGSPYAIGSAEGGHDAVHPALGGFEDFDRLVAAAAEHGLEIAIDFAIQCSPDHPWLKDHPGWFDWRPDGSIKYAENPPKKYQDIVNVDFYASDAVPGLWLALRDVVLLWIGHGVKTFRVDNPHTKPLPFWEWMIGEVRARHPDAIFLAEAFTRPNMMYRLAKVGFSQSYTYFTWRDGKQELVDYVTELTTTAPKDFYRPHFFVNTPDINPPFLQTSGRAGFRIRAALAATLSGLFGVYSGFELCEAGAIPGKEEYLGSEKYEIRVRDLQAPGNIITDITLLNRLRRTYPALQTHLNTRFYRADNDSVIYYGKPAPDDSDMILVMINLDPHAAQETRFEVPLWEFGLPDDGTASVEDLVEGYRFDWHGKDQTIHIAPAQPYRIWRIWSAA